MPPRAPSVAGEAGSAPLWAIGHWARTGLSGHWATGLLGHSATRSGLWGALSWTEAGAVEHAEEVSGELGLGPGGVGLAPTWSKAVESASLARAAGRTMSYHRGLRGSGAPPECAEQPRP